MSPDSTPAGSLLSVRIADLQAIEASLRTAHRELLEHTEAALAASRSGLLEWSDTTDSRRAAEQFARELSHRAELLVQALSRVADEVAATVERAQDTESRALAALD